MVIRVTKIRTTIFLLALLVVISSVGLISYSFGGHTASLTVKEVTPKQLAEAMQADQFYSDFRTTMLLMRGSVQSVSTQNNDSIAEFITTTSSSRILPKVFCDLGNTQSFVKAGDTITILSVAYDAQRTNNADVLLQNCYLFNK